MATLTLRLEIDPVTKKRNVWVKYDSDADALPMEHEQAHRRIVEALLAGGTLKAEELGTINVERPAEVTAATSAASSATRPSSAALPEAEQPVPQKAGQTG